MDKVGISAKRDRFPAYLSTGMKRSVAIARALAESPKAVLYDEPTTIVDPLMAHRWILRNCRRQQDLDIVAPGSVGIQTYESIAEIDYGLQCTRWLKIRRNLQYVINPGGTGKIPNAFVIGLYTEVTF